MILWIFMSCFTVPEPDPSAPEIKNWSDLAQTCTNDECTPEMCNNFYANPPVPSENDAIHLVNICSWLESDISAKAQFCSIKACIYLPTVSSVEAQKILFKDQPNTAGKKMARQAIIRTYLNTPKQFSELITSKSATRYADRWLRVAVAEAECNEGSIAKRLQIKCKNRSPIVALVLWEWALNLEEPFTKLAAFNLAMILDQKSVVPKLFDEIQMEDSKNKSSLASVLQLAIHKGLELNEQDRLSIQSICQTPPADLVNLCISLR